MWPHTKWPGLHWTFAAVGDMWDVVMGGGWDLPGPLLLQDAGQ